MKSEREPAMDQGTDVAEEGRCLQCTGRTSMPFKSAP
jgi:hypothetical protein